MHRLALRTRPSETCGHTARGWRRSKGDRSLPAEVPLQSDGSIPRRRMDLRSDVQKREAKRCQPCAACARPAIRIFAFSGGASDPTTCIRTCAGTLWNASSSPKKNDYNPHMPCPRVQVYQERSALNHNVALGACEALSLHSPIFDTEHFFVLPLKPADVRLVLGLLLQDEDLTRDLSWMKDRSPEGARREAFMLELRCAADMIKVWGIVERDQGVFIGAVLSQDPLRLDVLCQRPWDTALVSEEVGAPVSNWLEATDAPLALPH
jgi:hypothetical protein